MMPLEEAKATNMPKGAAKRGFETEVAADEDRAWGGGRSSGTGPKGPLLRRSKRRRTERPLCLLCGCSFQVGFVGKCRQKRKKRVKNRKKLKTSPPHHLNAPKTSETVCENLKVDGWIGEKQCLVTVDTGAASTMVRPELAEGLPEREMSVVTHLQSVSGHRIPVLKEVLVTLNLGKCQITTWALVANTVAEFTLGIEVMYAYGVILDLKHHLLQIGGQAVPLRRPWMHLLHEEQQRSSS
jgi:hypothetical protein